MITLLCMTAASRSGKKGWSAFGPAIEDKDCEPCDGGCRRTLILFSYSFRILGRYVEKNGNNANRTRETKSAM